MRLAKAWTAIDRLSIILKSDQSNKIKQNFFPATVMSLLLYGCTTWTVTKCMEKKSDWNYSRMLRVILINPGNIIPQNNSCMATYLLSQKPSKIRQTSHAKHCRRSKDKLINDVLLWTPAHRRASVCRPTRST